MNRVLHLSARRKLTVDPDHVLVSIVAKQHRVLGVECQTARVEDALSLVPGDPEQLIRTPLAIGLAPSQYPLRGAFRVQNGRGAGAPRKDGER